MSINIWNGYRYDSLFNVAGWSPELTAVFDALDTTNFEEVMEGLATTRSVSKAAGQPIDWIEPMYGDIRDGLFRAVRGAHIPWASIPDATHRAIAAHLNNYDKVFTLNYDLITYWSHVENIERVQMVDFFWGPGTTFDPLDTRLRGNNTAVYYLHGGLHLWKDVWTGQTGKWTHDGEPILTRIAGYYTSRSDRQPLFVSEGTSSEKRRSIGRSSYLSFAYGELANVDSPIAVFGASLGTSDKHIVDALNSTSRRRTVAISVRSEGRSDDDIVAYKVKMRQKLEDHRLLFFDAATHPLGDPSFHIGSA